MGKSIAPVWERTLAEYAAGPYLEYRIPGIVVTEKGTLLCVCEGRMDTRSDWGQIDIVLWRSENDGETWDMRVLRVPGEAMMNNPVLVVDGERVLLVLHTSYARAWCTESVDDGRTWSAVWEITGGFREFPYAWNVCASGPGHGIRTQAGRLIVPVWLANGRVQENGEIAHQPSGAGAVYSNDRGRTWHAGVWTQNMQDANETSVAQLADGRLLFNFRNRETDFLRRVGVSDAGGEALQWVEKCEALPDPWCFGGMAQTGDGEVVFVNCQSGNCYPENVRARVNLTAKITRNGDMWRTLARVADDAGYADVFVNGGDMYVLYEEGDTARDCIARLVLKKYRLEDEKKR